MDIPGARRISRVSLLDIKKGTILKNNATFDTVNKAFNALYL